MIRWAVLWRSKGGVDGDVERVQWGHGPSAGEPPVLFKTRKECREFIKTRYGYIAKRKDLRAYPHGWRMPQPVRVKLILERMSND